MDVDAIAWLRAQRREGAIAAVELHFGLELAARALHDPGSVALAGALLLAALRHGRVSADLGADAAASLPGMPLAPRALARALRAETGVCGEPAGAAPTPLLLDGDHLYLRRYWRSECRVVAALRARAATRFETGEAARALLARVFGDADPPPDQRLACDTVLARGLGIITGGPGTGKTTSVTRLLLALLADAAAGGRAPTIRLAAPTGKAAARLGESLRAEAEALRAQGTVDAALLEALPAAATTLHRLLGAGAGGFTHDEERPLDADVVVLDECSMIDLRLLDQLLRALPAQARLVLIGDGDQLAAVEAGSVFGALCRAPQDSAVGAARARLRHSWRFGEHGAIGRLARAVNAGDAAACAELRASDGAELGWLQHAGNPGAEHADFLCARYAPLVEAARNGAPHAELLARLQGFRVLCALREGLAGVSGINAAIERALAARGLIERGNPFHAGRPVLVTRNDHGARLYNGDLGVVLAAGDGVPRVLFAGAEGGTRTVPAAALPAHETAWAMTVHKSQGSEFDEVCLVLPDASAAGALRGGRELFYTAVTRARRALHIMLPQAGLEPRWLQGSAEPGGLDRRLAAAPATSGPE